MSLINNLLTDEYRKRYSVKDVKITAEGTMSPVLRVEFNDNFKLNLVIKRLMSEIETVSMLDDEIKWYNLIQRKKKILKIKSLI